MEKDAAHHVKMHAIQCRERGFTLVELMVTVAVIVIVGAIAAPNFANLIRSSRLTGAGNELVGLLQAARVAAVSQRATVLVCPTQDGTTCAAALGSRWMVRSTKTNTTLRESTLQSSITLVPSNNLSLGNNTFTFTPNGFSAVGANSSGTVGICSPQLGGNNAIDVSASVGRISTARRSATASCTAPTDN